MKNLFVISTISILLFLSAPVQANDKVVDEKNDRFFEEVARAGRLGNSEPANDLLNVSNKELKEAQRIEALKKRNTEESNFVFAMLFGVCSIAISYAAWVLWGEDSIPWLIEKEERIIGLALVLFLVNGLFPHWIADQKSFGYGFLFDPPTSSCKLDYDRLYLHWFVLAVLTGAAIYFRRSTGSKNRSQESPSNNQ